MSFKGKVVSKKKIESPFGTIELIEEEYEPFPGRSKIISWMGELDGEMVSIELGQLITIYHIKTREKNTQSIKYEPFYYEIILNDKVDSSHAIAMYFEEEQEEYHFDTKDEAMNFINLLEYRDWGAICLDSKAEFEKWNKVFGIVNSDLKNGGLKE